MQQVIPGSWSFPSEFGTPFLSGELTTEVHPSSELTSRKSERVSLEMGAGLRQRGGTGVAIQILDLSTDGFRASTHLQLAKGTDVWLRLPGLEPYQARVMWAKGNFVGCAFERPLHPAVLDMIVKKSGRP
ncbi:MAG TPA: PilZ domain-containing protein [Allosphingosinicella sp.]|nr:PilZ domain-containing protein [Allosphingosinicella sp.]